MRAAALEGFATATDLADYLVGKGVAFRDAHEIVALAVSQAEKKGCDLSELPLAALQQHSKAIGQDVFGWLTLEGSVARRNHVGGTAPAQVRRAVASGRKRLARR
jgi:argininosuccinate lyase